LAASGLLVLLRNGSQSNHVLLELAIAAAVLFTAPWGALTSTSAARRAQSGDGAGAGGRA
jgi:hypothetical protein